MVVIGVGRFIRTDYQNNIPQTGIIGQVPIFLIYIRGLDVFNLSRINFSKVLGVGCYRFFFEVSDKPVRDTRSEEIEEKVAVIKHKLDGHDQKAFKPARLGDVDERHHVHPFIVGFFDQSLNPALIFADVTDRLEVLQQTANHTGYGGNSFEDHSAVTIPFGEEHIWHRAHELYNTQRHTIAPVLWCVMHIANSASEVLKFCVCFMTFTLAFAAIQIGTWRRISGCDTCGIIDGF
jgi:hypothetical protein